MNPFSEPSTWMLLIIVIGGVLVRKPTMLGAAGLTCYGLSYAASNAYKFVPYDPAVTIWQASLLFLIGMYVAVMRWQGQTGRWQWILLLTFIPTALFALDIISRYTFEGILSLIVVSEVLAIFWRSPMADIFGKMIWAVMLLFEAWSSLEIVGCKLFTNVDMSSIHETWGVTISKSTCAIAFGPIAPYTIVVVTAALLAWIGARWNKVQKPNRS